MKPDHNLESLHSVNSNFKNKIHLCSLLLWKYTCVHCCEHNVESLSPIQLFATPWTAAQQASLSLTVSQSLLKFMSTVLMMTSNLTLLSPSPPALNLYHHHGLFQWIDFLHQVAKALELQLQHQSFQWIVKVNFI